VRVMVRTEGLEPPRFSPLEPKSSASAYSATPACAALAADAAQSAAPHALASRKPGVALKPGAALVPAPTAHIYRPMSAEINAEFAVPYGVALAASFAPDLCGSPAAGIAGSGR
jgi:hypothetical protein